MVGWDVTPTCRENIRVPKHMVLNLPVTNQRTAILGMDAFTLHFRASDKHSCCSFYVGPLRCKAIYLLLYSSVGYSKSLVDLRGITPSINCTLDLTYSAGQSKSFVLPMNWTFSFPFLIPGKSVTTQQRTYIIDPDCMSTLCSGLDVPCSTLTMSL